MRTGVDIRDVVPEFDAGSMAGADYAAWSIRIVADHRSGSDRYGA